MFAEVRNIWGNTDGFAEQDCCVAALYLLSTLEHVYNIIIDCGVEEPVHGVGVADGLNATNKTFISMFM